MANDTPTSPEEETGVHDAEMTNTAPVITAPGGSVVESAPSETLLPSMTPEDNERLLNQPMETTIIGPAGYVSPDPATSQGLLVPLEDHPLSDSVSPDYGESVANVSTDVPSSPLGGEGGGGTPVTVPEDLDEVTKSQLQNMAEERGLSTSGTKDEIAARIEDYDAEQTQVS